MSAPARLQSCDNSRADRIETDPAGRFPPSPARAYPSARAVPAMSRALPSAHRVRSRRANADVPPEP